MASPQPARALTQLVVRQPTTLMKKQRSAIHVCRLEQLTAPLVRKAPTEWFVRRVRLIRRPSLVSTESRALLVALLTLPPRPPGRVAKCASATKDSNLILNRLNANQSVTVTQSTVWSAPVKVPIRRSVQSVCLSTTSPQPVNAYLTARPSRATTETIVAKRPARSATTRAQSARVLMLISAQPVRLGRCFSIQMRTVHQVVLAWTGASPRVELADARPAEPPSEGQSIARSAAHPRRSPSTGSVQQTMPAQLRAR